jgi:16S rRNA (guanine527-N7)-methyltransferase
MDISDELIRRQLRAYGFIPSGTQSKQIRAYSALLVSWSKKISLTTIVDPGEILRTHFGESIFAVTSRLIGAGRLADVGTGAGFPGMALAIAMPALHVTLIEPNLKKTVFLAEVKRELQLSNIEIVRGTMKEVADSDFNFVSARALGLFNEFLDFAHSHTVSDGRVLLWLGEAAAKEIAQSASAWRWADPQPIPVSERRCILVGQK